VVSAPAVLDSPRVTLPESGPASVDPLRFLAGLRFTCYCGASVTGTTLCPACAEEMLDRLVKEPAKKNG
jgi:hypothetical protein